jgi:hypothetical protein
VSPTKKRGPVAGLKIPSNAATASTLAGSKAGSKAGPLSPRNFTTASRPETLQDKVCFLRIQCANLFTKMQFNNLKRTASGLVNFDQKSAGTQKQSKKERMEEAIRLLSDKEINLAKQYFSTIDRNKDGVLTKLELHVNRLINFLSQGCCIVSSQILPGLHRQQTRVQR